MIEVQNNPNFNIGTGDPSLARRDDNVILKYKGKKIRVNPSPILSQHPEYFLASSYQATHIHSL